MSLSAEAKTMRDASDMLAGGGHDTAERQPDAPTLRGAAEQARQASEQLTQDTPGISPTRENNR